MNARLSDDALALAVLHGQMENEKNKLLVLRKEQMRIAKEMLVSQRHLAACCETMERIINGTRHVYTAADL
jgi:hypothetical protein